MIYKYSGTTENIVQSNVLLFRTNADIAVLKEKFQKKKKKKR